MKHHIVATNLGYDDSGKTLRKIHRGRWDFAASVPTRLPALMQQKSQQREAVEVVIYAEKKHVTKSRDEGHQKRTI